MTNFGIGLRKKLDALAKEKDCDIIGSWTKSIINHLYWSAVSTRNGDGDLVEAKWLSIFNHIHNKHKKHGPLFSNCLHGRLSGRKNKKWLKFRK